MIIFNISGGLGNQLFQYAFGRSLAIKSNQELYLYTNAFTHDKARKFKLDYFNTNYTSIAGSEVQSYYKIYDGLHPLLKKWYRLLLPVNLSTYFTDKSEPIYHARLLAASRGYFDGYWAFEAYFKHIRETLLYELQIKNELVSPALAYWKNKLLNENTVAIHIRRGDYVSNATYSKLFGPLSLSYYYNAIHYIKKKVAQPVFYVFTDDRQWVAEHFKPQNNEFRFIEELSLQEDYLEFSLITSCRHFIIANSTFSWWAAWLGQQDDSVVIAPQKWYADEKWQANYEKSNFLPSTWIKIE